MAKVAEFETPWELPRFSCMTLGKLRRLSDSQFPHFKLWAEVAKVSTSKGSYDY
jgi:hypothetical protein